MKVRLIMAPAVALGSLTAQEPGSTIDVQGIRQVVGQEPRSGLTTADSTPKGAALIRESGSQETLLRKTENERLEREIRLARSAEKAPRRFAADLFETRQSQVGAGTEGGVSDEYVLGTGDLVQMSVFGSATFEVPVQVDGRGELVIPKVGTVRVGGMSLARARAAVQAKVASQFSAARVDLSVQRLREVRVFLLGEVYRPGGYLVPSLSSLVNVLGLGGGPTLSGSFRDIRVVRGGQVVHRLDLYPLRAEGLGNQNFYLQNGDTVFVPLAREQVLLEGPFLRIQPVDPLWMGRDEQRLVEAPGMGRESSRRAGPRKGTGRGLPGTQGEEPGEDPAFSAEREEGAPMEPPRESRGNAPVPGIRPAARANQAFGAARLTPQVDVDRQVSSMLFELLPGERASHAVAYAGGLQPSAHGVTLSLQRLGPGGVATVIDVEPSTLGSMVMQRGDVLSAFLRRDTQERSVSLVGWARVPGVFSRKEGMRVGDLLRRDSQVLPDTYLGRGEIVRTKADGATTLLVFEVGKALAGEGAHDLVLEDRDRVELFRMDRMRMKEQVHVQGPMTLAGSYPFHQGMRVSDLVFRAGVPKKSANRYIAELARARQDGPGQILKLDLSRLLSDDRTSPVDLKDEAINPSLRPEDQLSIFDKPEYKPHRIVKIYGQVQRPGVYSLDSEHPRLSTVIQRAGGLTDQAMLTAGMFFRRPGGGAHAFEEGDAESKNRASVADPTTRGLNDILERLNESKLFQIEGAKAGGPQAPVLFKPPILHGLTEAKLNRMVVNFQKAMAGDAASDPELLDGDEVIIPRRTDSVMVIGELASPFAYYQVKDGMKVKDLLGLAGGTTRNADTSNIRLLKADGRIVDSWVTRRTVEPGDALLVPQRLKRDSTWQENLQALTPIAILLNAIR